MAINALSSTWTAKEIEIFNARVLAGGKAHQIADELGRTVNAIHSRKRHLTKSWALRRAEAKVRRLREQQQTQLDHGQPIPPVFVLHERNVRFQIQHGSKTAALMGDPRPGYTARDTKRRALSVQDAIEICANYDSDLDASVLAASRVYGITPRVVFEILSGDWFDRLLPSSSNFNPEL